MKTKFGAAVLKHNSEKMDRVINDLFHLAGYLEVMKESELGSPAHTVLIKKIRQKRKEHEDLQDEINQVIWLEQFAKVKK